MVNSAGVLPSEFSISKITGELEFSAETSHSEWIHRSEGIVGARTMWSSLKSIVCTEVSNNANERMDIRNLYRSREHSWPSRWVKGADSVVRLLLLHFSMRTSYCTSIQMNSGSIDNRNDPTWWNVNGNCSLVQTGVVCHASISWKQTRRSSMAVKDRNRTVKHSSSSPLIFQRRV